MNDRIDLADMRKKLIAEPLAFAAPAHEAGNIDKLQLRRHDLGECAIGRKFIEPFIRTDTRRHWASIVQKDNWRLRRRRRRQRIEQGRFADIPASRQFRN